MLFLQFGEKLKHKRNAGKNADALAFNESSYIPLEEGLYRIQRASGKQSQHGRIHQPVTVKEGSHAEEAVAAGRIDHLRHRTKLAEQLPMKPGYSLGVAGRAG